MNQARPGREAILHYSFFINDVMQELIVLLIFAIALVYLGSRAYRSFSKKEAGCGKGCGCAADSKALTSSTKKGLPV